MSKIPRYSANPLWFPWCFVDNPSGKFCEYRDYVKLQAENERLRKAGELMDKVEAEWDRMQRSESGGCDIMYAVFNWKRYKEGRDAK